MAEEQTQTTQTTEPTQTEGHKSKHFTKPTKRQVYKFLLNLLFIVGGNAIAAGASAFFIVPNGFVMGGTTGLGIFVQNLLEKYSALSETATAWAVDITVYTANILLFVAGVAILGKKFAVATGAGTFLYPTFLTIYRPLQEAYKEATGYNIGCGGEFGSPMLAMLCGAVLFGLGIGLVLRVGASTGGTDIPPLIFKKLFNVPVAVTMWVVDLSIVFINLIAADLTAVIYGVFITIISSMMAEKLSLVGMNRIQVKIVSMNYKEIRDMIITKVSRGVTVLYGQTGYLKEPCHMLLTVISSRQLVTLKSEVQKIDPNAFMTVSNVSEVRGKGFHTEGVDFLMPQEEDSKLEMVADDSQSEDTTPPKE